MVVNALAALFALHSSQNGAWRSFAVRERYRLAV
jgi:hypothetical protein